MLKEYSISHIKQTKHKKQRGQEKHTYKAVFDEKIYKKVRASQMDSQFNL